MKGKNLGEHEIKCARKGNRKIAGLTPSWFPRTCLKGSLVRLTHGLAAPGLLDLLTPMVGLHYTPAMTFSLFIVRRSFMSD